MTGRTSALVCCPIPSPRVEPQTPQVPPNPYSHRAPIESRYPEKFKPPKEAPH